MTITPSAEAADAAQQTVRGLVDNAIAIPYYEKPIRDFAAARNELLTAARERGCDWAIMLDTDERISLPYWDEADATIGEMLANTDADVLMVPHVSGTYEKERLFRLPAKGHYHGRTHEAFIMDPGATRETVTWLAFDEIAKTPEQYRAKVERDLPLLEAMIEEDPDDPRWHYYAGDTLTGLGRHEEAMAAYERCWELDGWDEESAWAAMCIASYRATQERYDLAIRWCCDGLRRHPGMAELPWLAGWCCYQQGQHQRAIWWERMAIALNEAGASQQRISFRYPAAHFEAPFDVLRFAYQALGLEAMRADAQIEFEIHLAMRQEKIAPS